MILTLHPSLTIELIAGELYMLTSNTEESYEQLNSIDKVKLVNFEQPLSIKVISYFEQLNQNSIQGVKLFLLEKIQFKVDDHDFFGKLVIDVFQLLNEVDYLIVELSGLSNNSIECLIRLLKSYLKIESRKFLVLRLKSQPRFGGISFSLLSSDSESL